VSGRKGERRGEGEERRNGRGREVKGRGGECKGGETPRFFLPGSTPMDCRN